MKIQIYNLFSGSKGNATYIGTETEGFLIDCGKATQVVTDALNSVGIDPRQIKAVFITHSHSDHVYGVKNFIDAFRLPLLAAIPTIEEIDKMDSRKPLSLRNGVYVCEDARIIDNFEVIPFEVLHDVACQGIVIVMPDETKIGYVTDIAKVEDDVKDILTGCDYVIIESNYDPEMLANSDRSQELKDRISNGLDGHISNEECANLCVELCKTGTQHFMLAHLSEECNTPDLAKETFINKMKEAGFVENEHFTLDICKQEEVTICNTNKLPFRQDNSSINL